MDCERLLQENGTPCHFTVHHGPKGLRHFQIQKAEPKKQNYINPSDDQEIPVTPPEAFGPIGRKESRAVPSTPDEAFLPPKVTNHDPDREPPGTPEDAKMADYEQLRKGKRVHEENGRYYFYDTIGRKYECDEAGNKKWTSKRRPPQYDAYVWKKLGEDGRKAILEHFHNSPKKDGMVSADGQVIDEIDMSEADVQAESQNTYLSYHKNGFLHFHGESGPYQIPWKYVLKREVVDTDTGEILDLDKEIATRSQEYMCRPIPGGLVTSPRDFGGIEISIL